MNMPSNQDRIKNIYQMLFEMASGNFNYRLQVSNYDDSLLQIALVLNSVAMELPDAIIASGHVKPHYSYQNLAQVIILLDLKSTVTSYNNEALKIIGDNMVQPIKINFREMLNPQSRQVWDNIKKEVEINQNYHTTVQLIFQTKNKKVVPIFCTISRILYNDSIIITSVTTILEDLYSEITFPVKKILPKKTDAAIMQDVYDYILNHLEEPQPTIKEFSILFCISEYQLKTAFKRYFNISIYNLYTEERLKRGHQLIQQTTIPLKEIAYMIGFNDYVIFSKAFKRIYGYSPSELIRNEKDEN
ncbi:helix-turn-helix domain-containing protein [Flavobacterium pedocola]